MIPFVFVLNSIAFNILSIIIMKSSSLCLNNVHTVGLRTRGALSCRSWWWNWMIRITHLFSGWNYRHQRNWRSLRHYGIDHVNPCPEQCRRWIHILNTHTPTITISNVAHRRHIDPYNKSLSINRRSELCLLNVPWIWREKFECM